MPTSSDDINKVGDLPEDKLHPEFRRKMEQLTQTILAAAKEKIIFSEKYPIQRICLYTMHNSIVYVEGNGLAAVAEHYVTAINTGAVPDIASAWESVCKQSCDGALAKGIAYYKEKMDQLYQEFPVSTESILKAHDICLREAEGVFLEQSKSSSAEVQAMYRTKLGVREQSRGNGVGNH